MFMVVLTVLSVTLYWLDLTPVNVLGIATLSLALLSEKIDALLSEEQDNSHTITSTGTQE